MSDWTTDAANAIDNAVGLARERTVEPVQKVVRGLTYGVLAALILLPALVLTIIGAFGSSRSQRTAAVGFRGVESAESS